MGRVGKRSDRGRRFALLISLSVLVASSQGCGKSTGSGSADPTTGDSAGNGPESGAGGTGIAATSGRGEQDHGGATPAGGASQPMGGTAGDEPFTAGAGNAGAPDDCEPAPTRCFEPCAGDPSGNWVLEEACFRGGTIAGCQGGRVSGTARDLQMSMTLGDGEVLPRVTGRVTWDIVANAPPSCLGLGTDDSCGTIPLFLGPTGPLHASSSRAWLPSCEPSACGDCECAGESDDDTVLSLASTPYCADGDVLWVGGAGKSGEPKVSYKFRRRSCTGTPVPCAERAAAQCALGGDCRLGRCRAASGDVPQCAEAELELHCQTIEGCVWEPQVCTGSPRCNFATCEQVPGCSLGPPVAPHCAGQASCGGSLTVDECHEPGCSVQPCWGDTDSVSCEDLYQAECQRAPGCSWNGQRCAGTTRCDEQTDDDVCLALPFCDPLPVCGGTPKRACSSLSAANCHGLSGCFLEW
jgi:hypothetical protein